MKKLILYILPLLIIAISCDNNTSLDKNEDVVYFGGNIINPKDSLVFFVRLDRNRDTIKTTLDKNNFFLFELDSIKEMTYEFHHGEEKQFVFLSKNDSLMVRLNTLEFDESLVFTGVGASVNNYLIKKFLYYENNKISMLSLYSLEYNEFINTIDSLKQTEYKLLNDYNFNDGDFSESALEYVTNNLNYSEYTIKEQYATNYTYINKLDSLPYLPNDFYSYRNQTNLNDSKLINENFYFRFLYYRLNNYAIDSISKIVSQKKYLNNISEYDSLYTEIRNSYINSLFSNQIIKDRILYETAYAYFNNKISPEKLNFKLKSFFKNETDSSKIKIIRKLLKKHMDLQPGAIAPDFEVCNGKDSGNFSDYFGKPIYLYFWLSNNQGDKFDSWNYDIAKEYNVLKKEYPNIQFISVFLDFSELWESNLKINEANGIQLRANFYSIKKKYLLPSPTLFVLIDKDGKIIEANTSYPISSKIRAKLNKLKN